ncbi:MAG: hypothetical protein Q8916_00780 [Bacteroidota bacterium]|nr:hypothetical protein [Bacteroidota bacterium]
MKYLFGILSVSFLSCTSVLPTARDLFGYYQSSDTSRHEELILYWGLTGNRYIHIINKSNTSTGAWKFDNGARLEMYLENWSGIVLYPWVEYEGDTLKYIMGLTHFGTRRGEIIVMDSFRTYKEIPRFSFVKRAR